MTSNSNGVKFTINGNDQDMIVYKGTTVSFDVIYKDSSGDAIDITGYTANLVARETLAGAAKIDWDENTEITIGGSNGTFSFSVTATATALLDVFTGYYDFHVTSPSGDTDKLISGRCKVIGAYVQ